MKKRERKNERGKTRKEQEGKDTRNSLSPARDIAAGNFPEIRTEYKNRRTYCRLNRLNTGQETDHARPPSRRARAASLSPRSPRCLGLCLALIAGPGPICRLLQRVAATGTSLANHSIAPSLHRLHANLPSCSLPPSKNKIPPSTTSCRMSVQHLPSIHHPLPPTPH